MKIVTYNVNGINARLPRLLEYLDEQKPDIVCLQELKAYDDKIPAKAIEEAGYGAVWHGQKAFNGVAILARGEQPVEYGRGLPGDPEDEQSRYVEKPVILAGDFNVIPTDEDVYSVSAMQDDALMQPESREALRRIIHQGWTDAIRARIPSGKLWTFWDYQRGAWQRDAGFRIDHLLLSPVAADRLRAAGVDKEYRGREKASDHAPTWAELAE
ncbi:MAG: endonuclease/exonuclease/phosphatase family protein [Sphingomonadales bacterium]|nr:endonuclease/exonuclease/phosphatase family protein [Sphingomonadales bacterium]